MEIIIAIAVVGVLGVLVGVGVATGKTGNPPTISLPEDEKSPADCQQACAAWDKARQMECRAKADEAAARSRADAIRGQMLASIAAAVSLSAAGVAALVAVGTVSATLTILAIPLVVWLLGIAIGLFIAAAAATAAAAVLAGQLVAAESDSAAKAAARSGWGTAVANARNEVNMKCPLGEANACLSRTAPC